MDGVLISVVAIGSIAFFVFLWLRAQPKKAGAPPALPAPVVVESQPVSSPEPEARPPVQLDPTVPLAQQLPLIDTTVGEAFDRASNPQELEQSQEFCAARDRMLQPDVTAEELFEHYSGPRGPLAWPAVKALGLRPDGAEYVPRIIESMGRFQPWTRFFALQAIHEQNPGDPALVSRVLLSLDSSWNADANAPPLSSFLTWRSRGGETLSFGELLRDLSIDRLTELDEILARMPAPAVATLREEIQRAMARVVDVLFLESFGRVRRDSGGAEQLIEHPALARQRTQLLQIVRGTPARSVLVVGESGVGKSSLMRSVAAALVADGWLVFEAAPEELNAEQKYIGELEGRVTHLIRELAKRRGRAVWLVRDAEALAWTGRSSTSRTSALDMLLPAVESGDVLIVGETEPAAYERLLLSKPRVGHAFVEARIEPADEATSLDLARRWAARGAGVASRSLVSEALLTEAWGLTQQYLSDAAPPGNLMNLLKEGLRHSAAGREPSAPLRLDDLLAALASSTGLPVEILDDRASLDLVALQRNFESRVMGQPEAVRCLVERVAMIKAGVTDPSRPAGVFLFVGPTGTGKTELAKSLATFLFGGENRMIRLDMSELQSPDAIGRIVGELGDQGQDALVDQIRKQPFSVVLLDEFEKSHPNVWDLFLQVFDDGRLTDRRGRTADFRHAIVIMTSNLGSTVTSGLGVGFSDDYGRFSAANVERATAKVFRKEFLNRIDRIVVFKPLSRETMRDVLRKQLRDAFARRGLRNRTWAVEWDAAALEFLLEQGFTVDLGARPLQRAIERHLLAPLAETIVNHRVPEGDQFLFVRTDGERLHVEFVDPDAPATVVPPVAASSAAAADLPSIALTPRGSSEELATLESEFERLRLETESDVWSLAKSNELERMSDSAFWESTTRFDTLGRVEYRERIETALETAGSLLARLRSNASRDRVPVDLLARLAQQLMLVSTAIEDLAQSRPREAFVVVETVGDVGPRSGGDATAFAKRVAAMYRRWAEKRGMRLTVLETRAAADSFRELLAVSGLGAYSRLAADDGYHVLEVGGDDEASAWRTQVRVRVVGQPPEPPRAHSIDLAEQARRTLAAAPLSSSQVVRRYREHPSPLVRDAIRGWRTGRLDWVEAGHFDLIP